MSSRLLMEPGTIRSTSPRRRFADKAAKWIVTAGGLAIIASILGILVFLLLETAPLARGAQGGDWRTLDLGSRSRVVALTCDPYQAWVAALDETGRLNVAGTRDGKIAKSADILAGRDPRPLVVAAQVTSGGRAFAAATSDGRVVVQAIEWKIGFQGSQRTIDPVFGRRTELALDPGGRPLGAFAVAVDESHTVSAVAQAADGRVRWVKQSATYNQFSEEWEEGETLRRELPFEGKLTCAVADAAHHHVHAASDDRRLLRWTVDAPADPLPFTVLPLEEPATLLGLLSGQRSLVVGGASGNLSIWFDTRAAGEIPRLTEARTLPALGSAATLFQPSERNKGFLVATAAGSVAYCYGTTSAIDWRSTVPLPGITAIAIAPKVDAILAATGDKVHIAAFRDPHPEATLGSLFEPIWYEGYDEPSHTWQSTGGTDDFEIKLGLVPLIFGTLKGTIFAMLLSIPLAVLGAMFVSQFLHPDLRKFIKPAIEIMAAMPSVILGFVAALWLAPLVEVGFPAFVLMPFVLPLLVVLTGLAWLKVPQAVRGRFPVGSEALVFVVVIAAGIGICTVLSRPLEVALFGGDFPDWVRAVLGLEYDQKNSVVIAIAMSFAVIPIIFTISEDAFSNVPRNLVAGSLALGANRWQTVTRVVLPTASPGIFSATMVGFGRAIGETMIVLMATGNTPIMEWNPFNGFRTLSANIAVEIPEAPHGGTLYRTLFLAALLLFALTFVINTLAELVRQRLRRRYASL